MGILGFAFIRMLDFEAKPRDVHNTEFLAHRREEISPPCASPHDMVVVSLVARISHGIDRNATNVLTFLLLQYDHEDREVVYMRNQRSPRYPIGMGDLNGQGRPGKTFIHEFVKGP